MKTMMSWIAAIAIVVFCACAWMTKSPETAWLIMPSLGLFRVIAGTWNKPAARFMAPLTVTLGCLMLAGWSWWILAVYPTYLAVNTLPVTLKGDSVHEHWYNWLWVWLMGGIKGLPALAVALAVGHGFMLTLLLCLVPLIITGLMITGSNLKATKRFFPWKFCEFVMGSFDGYQPAFLLNGM